MTHTTNEVSGDLYITWDIYNKAIENLALSNTNQVLSKFCSTEYIRFTT